MNFTALLPSGLTKDCWIAQLPVGSIFTTRRTQKCASCGENSLKHNNVVVNGVPRVGICLNQKMKGGHALWQPLPPVLKVGKKIEDYAKVELYDMRHTTPEILDYLKTHCKKEVEHMAKKNGMTVLSMKQEEMNRPIQFAESPPKPFYMGGILVVAQCVKTKKYAICSGRGNRARQLHRFWVHSHSVSQAQTRIPRD